MPNIWLKPFAYYSSHSLSPFSGNVQLLPRRCQGGDHVVVVVVAPLDPNQIRAGDERAVVVVALLSPKLVGAAALVVLHLVDPWRIPRAIARDASFLNETRRCEIAEQR